MKTKMEEDGSVITTWSPGRTHVVKFERERNTKNPQTAKYFWKKMTPSDYSDYDGQYRTHYQALFSITKKIPILSVIALKGEDICWRPRPMAKAKANTANGQGELVMKKKEINRDGPEWISDLRMALRPKEWLKSDQAYMAEPPLQGSSAGMTDYVNKEMYEKNENTDHYDKGHLVASVIFRKFFIKEQQYMGDISIPWAYSSVMTNIFPQVRSSNQANDQQNPNNWYVNEQHEEQAIRACFNDTRKNTFHIAHGTIPSQETTMGKWVSGNMKKYESGHSSELDSEVNVPKYFYMAFCCSTGDFEFIAEFQDRSNDIGTRSEKRQTTQFAVFEHLDPRISEGANHQAGDRITTMDQEKFFADLESLWEDNGNDMKNFPLQKSQENCLGFKSKFHETANQ